jgi:hypothetical protein
VSQDTVKEKKLVKLIVPGALLLLTGCVDYNMTGASPEGGTVSAVGNQNLMLVHPGIVQQQIADRQCARYGKKAVLVGDPTSAEVDFKCVEHTEPQQKR